MLENGERLDDLELASLRLIQHPKGYCFTSDSVILANFVKAKQTDRILEIGTGSGVIAILIAAKCRLSAIVAVEIQPRLASLAKRNVELNGLSDKIAVVNADILSANEQIGREFDAIVVNPPYEPIKNRVVNQIPLLEEKVDCAWKEEKEICRAEHALALSDCIREGAKRLKFGGLFYMVHRVRRMAEVLAEMKAFGIEPKQLLLVQPKKEKMPDTFVVEGKKGANPGLIMPVPLVVYEEDGRFTERAAKLYGKEYVSKT